MSDIIASPRTSIHLTRASLAAAARALVCGIALVGVAELTARTSLTRAWLGTPSVGTRNYQFDVQVARLDEFVRRDGAPECLIIGSSIAYRGLDPAAIAAAYRARTGRALRCFTFGVGGLRLDEASVVARVFVERLRPKLVIYVTGPADYLHRGVRAVLPSAWLDYHLGERTLTGWLIEHSRAYRYYLRYRGWRTPGHRATQKIWATYEANTAPDGFGAGMRGAAALRRRAARQLAQAAQMPPRHVFHADAERLMDQLVRVRDDGARLIFVEAPLGPSATDFISMRPDEIAAIRQRAMALAAARGIPWWEARALAIPDDAWRDPIHLKVDGAQRFSAWLGDQLAATGAP